MPIPTETEKPELQALYKLISSKDLENTHKVYSIDIKDKLHVNKNKISLWLERWFLSSNAKDIGVLYLIFALLSGLIGTAFSVLIRLELSGPGVQYIADNQLYNSIITAHAIVMIFFMVMPAMIGGFGNFVRRRRFIIVPLWRSFLIYDHSHRVRSKGKPNFELSISNMVSMFNKLLKEHRLPTVVFMVKAILPEVYRLLPSTKWGYQGSYGVTENIFNLGNWLMIWELFTRYIINIFKDESGQPNRTLRIRKTTPWLPKGGNSYGNRVAIVPFNAMFNRMGYRGRATVRTYLSKRSYCTGRAMAEAKIITKLRELHERSKNYPNLSIDRNLYKILCGKEILLLAYQKLRSNPGNMTKGSVPETLDGISTITINNLIAKLKDESFRFSAGRRVQIPKASGGLRPLTIASPRDKLVQEAMRMILEAIWEPLFADNSHGFRTNRSCHTALKQIKDQFKSSVWVIEGDISKCFDSIDHNKLMELIELKIQDRKFTRLIRKSLEAGYFEFKVYSNNLAGTPQGSIVSPILSNIFMSQLDDYINSLKSNFDVGTKTKISPRYNSLHHQMTKARKAGDMESLLKLAKMRRGVSYSNFEDSSFKKLNYVRYADDWVIGVRGTRQDTLNILNSVRTYLSSVGLTLSDSKTKVTNLNIDKVLFLGTEITRARKHSFVRVNKVGILKKNSRQLRLMAPLERIVSRLHMASFMKNNISYPKFVWMSLEHRQILHLYNSVLRGILNYYNFVHNYGKLVSRTTYMLKQSCAKLLAAKFSLHTMSKVYTKFGSNLEYVHVSKENKKKVYSFIKPSYKLTFKFIINSTPVVQTLYGSKSIANLDDLVCVKCESSVNVEMHHIRQLKDLNPNLDMIDKLMASRKRKQIPLCRACHVDKHAKVKVNRMVGGSLKH